MPDFRELDRSYRVHLALGQEAEALAALTEMIAQCPEGTEPWLLPVLAQERQRLAERVRRSGTVLGRIGLALGGNHG